MGVVAFSLTNIWFALETADEEKSVFSAETLQNPTLLKAAGIAFLFTILATELRITNAILDTVNLSVEQWMTAFVVSLAVLVIAEVKKLLKIRTTTLPALATSEPASAAA